MISCIIAMDSFYLLFVLNINKINININIINLCIDIYDMMYYIIIKEKGCGGMKK